MIDFHSHILPGIDDGARNVKETFALIDEAERVGFDTIISTSHYIEGYYESNVSQRNEWINAINKKLEDSKKNIRVHLGNEIYFTNKIITLLKEGKATTVKGTDYVLFEIPLQSNPLNLYDVVYDMLQNKLRPVLAHPERYDCVKSNPTMIYELIEKGVLMQSNFGSIIGIYGGKTKIIVKKMLENNMVHFLGSDVHRVNSIYPKIPEILENIREIVGRDKLEELTTINPELVLKNEEIDIDTPEKIQLSFKEKIIMNRP